MIIVLFFLSIISICLATSRYRLQIKIIELEKEIQVYNSRYPNMFCVRAPTLRDSPHASLRVNNLLGTSWIEQRDGKEVLHVFKGFLWQRVDENEK